ncbi:MAG: maleylpyruvate isomerase family mycothiol-dependent enzyme [Jatrophihabitans sp.]
MTEPTAMLAALRASSADLMNGLAEHQWSEDDLRAPSLCEGWSRGHVLTHLARNADGISTTLSGALRGEVVHRYPDGWDARNAEITAGATRGVAAQVADVEQSAARLDRVFGAVTEAGLWGAMTDQGHRADEWPARRLREVEIHRIDLAGTYRPSSWPSVLVADLLPEAAGTLTGRTTAPLLVRVTAEGSIVPDLVGAQWSTAGPAPLEVAGPDFALLAWLVGRGSTVSAHLQSQPELTPWG